MAIIEAIIEAIISSLLAVGTLFLEEVLYNGIVGRYIIKLEAEAWDLGIISRTPRLRAGVYGKVEEMR